MSTKGRDRSLHTRERIDLEIWALVIEEYLSPVARDGIVALLEVSESAADQRISRYKRQTRNDPSSLFLNLTPLTDGLQHNT
jgi:hypothetical protein